MNFDTTYADYHNLESVTENFYDYLCGELDFNLEVYQEEEDGGDYFSSIARFTNGDIYLIEIFFDEDDKEWFCSAEFLKKSLKQFHVCQVDEDGEHCLTTEYEAVDFHDAVKNLMVNFYLDSIERVNIKKYEREVFGKGFNRDGEYGNVQYSIQSTIELGGHYGKKILV